MNLGLVFYLCFNCRAGKLDFKQSEECALMALERPLRCCPEWTAMDLVVKAECDKVPPMRAFIAFECVFKTWNTSALYCAFK